MKPAENGRAAPPVLGRAAVDILRRPLSRATQRTARRNACTLALILSACAASCSDPEPPRNLLVIAVDTLRADRLGTYGYSRPTSAGIDELFESAVVFEDAHSTAPWTLPSFASLMTSTHVSTHRCWQRASKLDESFTTLAEVMASQGFHTRSIVSHTFLGTPYGLAQGFVEHDESLVYDDRTSSHAISSPPVTQKAIAFLEQTAGRADADPWFLWVHYFDPHIAYQAHRGVSERFGTREDPDLYDGEIAFTDHHIARLLRKLEQLGFADDTVVAFVSDHGEEFFEHGRKGHGKTLFQEVLRIPFAIRVPGIEPRRVQDTVSVVDFMPTMLELFELPPPPTPLAGNSLLGLMRGQHRAERDVLMQAHPVLRQARLDAFIHGRWKLIREVPDEGKSRSTYSLLLFDHDADPGETRDLAAQHPEIVPRPRAADGRGDRRRRTGRRIVRRGRRAAAHAGADRGPGGAGLRRRTRRLRRPPEVAGRGGKSSRLPSSTAFWKGWGRARE